MANAILSHRGARRQAGRRVTPRKQLIALLQRTSLTAETRSAVLAELRRHTSALRAALLEVL